MGYAIELSIDVRKASKMLSDVRERRQLAEDHMCEMQYFMHEIEGRRKNVVRSDSIQVVMFETENLPHMLEYITKIRKERLMYVECVYREDRTCDLLYASPKYLQRMDKNIARTFKRQMKNKAIEEEDEKAILSAIRRN